MQPGRALPPPPAPESTGPTWALVVGGILIGLACFVALGAALNRDYPPGEAVGFVIGAPLFPFLLMLGGRAIWLRMQNSRAPVLDWPWIIFGTGKIGRAHRPGVELRQLRAGRRGRRRRECERHRRQGRAALNPRGEG